ncbi:uncharacterized protein LOC142162243 [Nicotiana tabacum]|uniref:Uncharacterized protein LOC142162243 n=1 Tax=Nicotiana tabacum TaxID=4097 RepID=A0AC58RPM4_TOBAC
MKREKLDNQFAKFLEILKQIHINIPFTDALLQMSSYAKFLKEILSRKRKLEEVSVVMLTEKCSAILQNKLPQKLGDQDLGEMKDTCVSLQFADQSTKRPKGIIENVLAIIDAHKGQLILRVDEERVIFDMQKVLRFSEDDTSSSCFSIDMINNLIDEFKDDQLISDSMERCLAKSGTTQDEDPTIRSDAKLLEKDYEEGDMQLEKEERLIKVLKAHKGALRWTVEDIKGINPAIFTHRILMEDSYKSIVQPQRRLNPAMQEVVKKEIVKLLAACIIYPISDSPWVSPVQRCMSAIFSDMTEKLLEIFMDDFTLFGKGFEDCLHYLTLVLKRCEETNLILKWKKCNFMVTEEIILGHKITAKGIEVDKAKINLIAGLPPPTTVRDIRSFLGHACFYRRFIKGFSKISKPLTNLLMKDVKFEFSGDCMKAFDTLKEKLSTAPIVVSPNWNQLFEIMCDASDTAVGAVLDNIIRRCVPEEEMIKSLYHCHDGAVGGHYAANCTAFKVLEVGFFWPILFKDARAYVAQCDRCQRTGNITKRDEIPLQSIQEKEYKEKEKKKEPTVQGRRIHP